MTVEFDSPGNVEAIGFDLDGTLFDHRGSATDAVRSFLQGLGFTPTDGSVDLWFAAEEAEFEAWRTGRVCFRDQRRRRLRRVFTALGVEFEDEPQALDSLFARYLAEYRRAWRLFPDVIRVLSSCRGRGYRLGLLTNGSEEQQRDKLAVLGLAEMFDAVCISEAIGVQKPDARAFGVLARSLNVECRHCAFVGDNPDQDVAGATAVGMRAVVIERGREGAPGLATVLEAVLA